MTAPKIYIFWYAKILTQAFLHDSHTFDFGGFFTFLVALAHGAALYESHGMYIYTFTANCCVHTLVFPHLSMRRLETNLIWVRVKWHYELYHRNHYLLHFNHELRTSIDSTPRIRMG